MTNYQRQKYIGLGCWTNEVVHKESYSAEQKDAGVYIYWTDGPDCRIGVSEDKQLYRLVEIEDNWRIYFYDRDAKSWRIYSPSTAQTYEYHMKQFGKNVTFHIPAQPEPDCIYGVNHSGTLFRLTKES